MITKSQLWNILVYCLFGYLLVADTIGAVTAARNHRWGLMVFEVLLVALWSWGLMSQAKKDREPRSPMDRVVDQHFAVKMKGEIDELTPHQRRELRRFYWHSSEILRRDGLAWTGAMVRAGREVHLDELMIAWLRQTYETRSRWWKFVHQFKDPPLL